MIDTKHEFVSQLPSQVTDNLVDQTLSKTQKITAKRGRPRDPERFQRIIDTATIQFITLGYERTSLTAISKLSGIIDSANKYCKKRVDMLQFRYEKRIWTDAVSTSTV